MSSQLHLTRGVGVFTQQIETTLFQKKKKMERHSTKYNNGNSIRWYATFDLIYPKSISSFCLYLHCAYYLQSLKFMIDIVNSNIFSPILEKSEIPIFLKFMYKSQSLISFLCQIYIFFVLVKAIVCQYWYSEKPFFACPCLNEFSCFGTFSLCICSDFLIRCVF